LGGETLSNKHLKNRVQIGSAIDKELYNQLKQYSEETGIPISKLMDRALKLLFKELSDKNK